MAAAGEEERLELELEVAAILCDLKRILRARDRRRRRRMMREEDAPVIPSWGRRRLRSLLEDGKPSAVAGFAERDSKPSAAAGVAERDGKPSAAAGVAERDGAASPDTPLAFPEEDDDAAKKARAQAEWVQEQRVVVASLSQENADLLKQIEEYRARLLSSRRANESLKQLHKVWQQEEQARKMRMLALRPEMTTIPCLHRPLAALGLDLNKPARLPDDEAEAARARAIWQVQQLHKAAARRRRLEILRAKVASPLVSCRTRRVLG